jgi:hypothetical protein
MGTRHLTMVVHENKTKIAQYGQWDGYPSGQGVTVLTFLRKRKLDVFKEKLKNVRFINDEDQKKINTFMKSIGSEDGWMNQDQADKYHAAYPYLSRDIGADILDLVYGSNGDEIMLKDSTDFAGDSLFCEWAYVIDLDKNNFEIYSGFNKKPLGKNQRFKDTSVEKDSAYTPIRCIKKYSLKKLPTKAQFIKDLKSKEEE